MSTNWIWKENFWPVIAEIAILINYDFDESDQIAIKFGFKDTDAEDNRWFDYEFHGDEIVRLQVSDEMGADTCMIKIEASTKVEKLIDYLFYIAQTYWIKPRK